jgi:predicted RND superfamily exporter protein
MIVLPLIFGIGIDDGVHLLHDYFQHRGRYRLDNATFVAVLLTSVTTMVGFGSLVLSQHQGLRSLGQVLTLGVMCCLLSSTTLLPALFVVWSSKAGEEEPQTVLLHPLPVGEGGRGTRPGEGVPSFRGSSTSPADLDPHPSPLPRGEGADPRIVPRRAG